MAAKNRFNVCFIDVLQSDSYLDKCVIYLFYQPPYPHPKLYDALCSVTGGLISPNVAANDNGMILPPYHSE